MQRRMRRPPAAGFWTPSELQRHISVLSSGGVTSQLGKARLARLQEELELLRTPKLADQRRLLRGAAAISGEIDDGAGTGAVASGAACGSLAAAWQLRRGVGARLPRCAV